MYKWQIISYLSRNKVRLYIVTLSQRPDFVIILQVMSRERDFLPMSNYRAIATCCYRYERVMSYKQNKKR